MSRPMVCARFPWLAFAGVKPTIGYLFALCDVVEHKANPIRLPCVDLGLLGSNGPVGLVLRVPIVVGL